MAARKYIEVIDAAGESRRVTPIDAKEISEIAKTHGLASTKAEAPDSEGQQPESEAPPTADAVKELAKANTRAQLNSMAAKLGLEPSDYQTKEDIASAIADLAEAE